MWLLSSTDFGFGPHFRCDGLAQLLVCPEGLRVCSFRSLPELCLWGWKARACPWPCSADMLRVHVALFFMSKVQAASWGRSYVAKNENEHKYNKKIDTVK